MIAQELKEPITKEELKGFSFIKVDGYDIMPNFTLFTHRLYETDKIKRNIVSSRNTTVYTGVNSVKPDIIQASAGGTVEDTTREINSYIAGRNTRKSRFFIVGVKDETLKAHRRPAPRRRCAKQE